MIADGQTKVDFNIQLPRYQILDVAASGFTATGDGVGGPRTALGIATLKLVAVFAVNSERQEPSWLSAS